MGENEAPKPELKRCISEMGIRDWDSPERPFETEFDDHRDSWDTRAMELRSAVEATAVSSLSVGLTDLATVDAEAGLDFCLET
jgi:hypothetical protein